MTALHMASWIGYLMAILTGIRIVESVPCKRSVFEILLTCLTCCCGGGFIFRDLMILRVYPSILNLPMEVLNLVLLTLLLWENKSLLLVLTGKHCFSLILTILDGIGLAGFVICGCQNAAELPFPVLISLSGIVTGTGGGFLARTFSGITPSLNPSYLGLAFILSILYSSNTKVNDMDIITIAVGGLFCPLTDPAFIRTAWNKISKVTGIVIIQECDHVVFLPVIQVFWINNINWLA